MEGHHPVPVTRPGAGDEVVGVRVSWWLETAEHRRCTFVSNWDDEWSSGKMKKGKLEVCCWGAMTRSRASTEQCFGAFIGLGSN